MITWNSNKLVYCRIEEFSQELAGVLNENIALYEQQERENDESGIWRQRYY